MGFVSMNLGNPYIVDLDCGAPGEPVLKHSTAAPSQLIQYGKEKRHKQSGRGGLPIVLTYGNFQF